MWRVQIGAGSPGESMRHSFSIFSPAGSLRPAVSLLMFCSSVVAGPAESAALPAVPGAEVQELGEGVYSVVRNLPSGFYFESNSVFIVTSRGVVVVDSQFTRAATKAALAALRQLTGQPVRYVINTHWHVDHISGNQVYREAFPEAEFIAHVSTREDLSTEGLPGRPSFLEALPPTIGYFDRLVAERESMGDGVATGEELAAYAADSTLATQHLEEAPGFQPVLPTLTFRDHLTLELGGRTIELHHFGRAHTRGDIVVYLPGERILVAGDIVVAPVPLVGSTSYPGDYPATLAALLALQPAVIVPGHGPVLRDTAYIELMAELLEALRERTTAAVARGETLEQARKSVDLEEFRQRLAGSSRLRSLVFSNYVLEPAVTRMYAEAAASRAATKAGS